MRTATTVVVAGVVVLASMLAGGALAADHDAASAALQADNGTNATAAGNDTRAPNDTATGQTNETGPANDTTAGNDTNASALPPGVSEAGVENASALVAAHRRGLAATGYRYVLAQNASFEESPVNVSALPMDGFTTDSYERGAVEAGLAPFHLRSTGETTVAGRTANVSTETWGNETTLVVRSRVANQVNTQHVNLTREGDAFFELTRDDANDSVTKAHVVRLTLESGSFEVVNASGEFVTLRATEFDALARHALGVENVTRYDARVVVDRQGVVHQLSLVVESETEHLRYDFGVVERGAVDVTRPDWVGPALQPGCGCAPAGNWSDANATTGNASTERP